MLFFESVNQYTKKYCRNAFCFIGFVDPNSNVILRRLFKGYEKKAELLKLLIQGFVYLP